MAFDFKKDLAKRVAKNPSYQGMVDSLGLNDDDMKDAYFYAFKDAYERNGFKPTEENIREELSDRYWGLADSYRERMGYGQDDEIWEREGPSFVADQYGPEEEFISNGIEAWKGESGTKGNTDRRQRIDDIVEQYLSLNKNVGVDEKPELSAANIQGLINRSGRSRDFITGAGQQEKFYDEILDIIRSRKGGK